ncbi:hypothetical protein [Pseudorhizobium pelagicum]|uniref:Uncharacterized protein n=1 Tax=Pseudorhizobium pelagicum TaxID=1509405 RepID=A0A922T908_9HYPH|nr:hypothetical protein [Pseudorhizobium pelagicum]KEQ05726.1 hypothetical protein GV67_03985 [Pseudorhizobium pelagicum]KEQ06406.1 hypothetical protein GV68_06980 [Pseudorhizobium pelagicum]
MTKVLVSPIKSFPLTGRALCLTDEAGQLTAGCHKDGSPLEQRFSGGAFTLAEADGSCLVPPADFAAVLDYCERIIEGDVRASTAPGVVMMLAAAVMAVMLSWPVASPPEPAAAAMGDA